MSPNEIYEKFLLYFPILFFVLIIVGFLVAEWGCAYSHPAFQSILHFGFDKQVKLI